jgi:hypothetical protein
MKPIILPLPPDFLHGSGPSLLGQLVGDRILRKDVPKKTFQLFHLC